jgi:hypothetical protein
MAAERRWYIELRVIGGPLESGEVQSLQGPTVEVGTQPREGGLKLPAGRGVAPKHCMITAYASQQVHVTPVGHNQVRLAPYADVDWAEQEPISDRVYLKPGNALHLGPTGQRGVTLEFVACHDLGVREVEVLASEAEPQFDPSQRPPDGIRAVVQRPSVGQLVTGGARSRRVWLAFGVMLMLSALFTLVALLSVLEQARGGDLAAGSTDWEKLDFSLTLPPPAPSDFDGALKTFVRDWNERLARDAQGLGAAAVVETDDPRFFHEVKRVFLGVGKLTAAYRHYDRIKGEYAEVLGVMRAADPQLPDVFAGIPEIESEYRATAVSPCCAVGWWQFMPEFGARLRDDPLFGPEFDVAGCGWQGRPGLRAFTPRLKAPPSKACERGEYVLAGRCILDRCERDFRTSLGASTKVAAHYLGQALHDPTLAASGAAVQIAIASHNAGYNDRPYYEANAGISKPMNVLVAYERWTRERSPGTPTSWFHGESMKCLTTQGPAEEGCQRFMMRETQRYAVQIVGRFFVAMCFYAKNYPHEPAFAPWKRFAQPGQFCDMIPVPTLDELNGGLL